MIAKEVTKRFDSLNRDINTNFVQDGLPKFVNSLMLMANEVWNECPKSADGSLYFVFPDKTRVMLDNPCQEVFPAHCRDISHSWVEPQSTWIRVK